MDVFQRGRMINRWFLAQSMLIMTWESIPVLLKDLRIFLLHSWTQKFRVSQSQFYKTFEIGSILLVLICIEHNICTWNIYYIQYSGHAWQNVISFFLMTNQHKTRVAGFQAEFGGSLREKVVCCSLQLECWQLCSFSYIVAPTHVCCLCCIWLLPYRRCISQANIY